MRLRAFTHLTIATVAAAGAITLSLHLAQDGAPARAVTTASAASVSAIVNPTGSGPSSTATAEDASAGEPARRTTGARNVLEQRVAAPATAVAATAGTRAGSTPVDESKPHEHVVDPETGGLISVAGAVGTVPAAQDLGPVHADPMPTGVDLADPTDTASLLERAGVVQAGLAAADQPVTTGASAPIGTPGIATLGSHVAPSCTGDRCRRQAGAGALRARAVDPVALRGCPSPAAQRGRQRRRRVRGLLGADRWRSPGALGARRRLPARRRRRHRSGRCARTRLLGDDRRPEDAGVQRPEPQVHGLRRRQPVLRHRDALQRPPQDRQLQRRLRGVLRPGRRQLLVRRELRPGARADAHHRGRPAGCAARDSLRPLLGRRRHHVLRRRIRDPGRAGVRRGPGGPARLQPRRLLQHRPGAGHVPRGQLEHRELELPRRRTRAGLAPGRHPRLVRSDRRDR